MSPGGRPPSSAASSGRSSTLVAAGILLSRVSGLARESAMGAFLGTGLALEAFRAALRIPNLLQNLLGEGALSASFIPVYARLRAEGRDAEAERLAGAVLGLLLLLTGTLVLVGVLFARPLTVILAWGYEGEKLDLTVDLVRILFPGIGFLVLSAWCLGVLNSHRRFFLSYVAPVLWNTAMIVALVGGALAGLARTSLAVALAVGTVLGGLAQFGLQLPSVRRLLPGLRPTVRNGPHLRAVLRGLGPVVGGRGVVQLLSYVTLVLATLLATGAVASLTFAQVLYLLPISLFGMSVAAAELPELSTQGRVLSVDESEAATTRLDDGLARVAFFVVPTMVGYLLLGDLIVDAILGYFRFDDRAVVQVWVVLAGFTPGLLAGTSARLLQSVLYGRGDTRTPAVLAALRVAVAAALGAVLMLQFDQLRIAGTGITQVGPLPSLQIADATLRAAAENQLRLGALGLSLATGMSAWLEFALLRRAVGRLGVRVRVAGGQLRRIGLCARRARAGRPRGAPPGGGPSRTTGRPRRGRRGRYGIPGRRPPPAAATGRAGTPTPAPVSRP